MANGIKLRRGLKTSLGTIAEGELAYATDTKELALPDGRFVKLDYLVALAGITTNVADLDARITALEPEAPDEPWLAASFTFTAEDLVEYST
jgi:hypothetical protein